MRPHALAITLVGIALAGPAMAGEVPKETADRIEQVLAEIGCKPGEIETDDKGYEVDDAQCEDGENDIKLDKDLRITSRRKD